MDVVLVAIIAGVLGPAVMALLTGRQRREEKREDWARQDEVAARVATATQVLEGATARQTQANTVTSGKLEETSGKLDGLKEDVGQVHQDVSQVHQIVNSNSMRAERDAIARELVWMRQIGKLHQALGQEPDDELIKAIEAGEVRCEELTAILDAIPPPPPLSP